MAYDEGLAERVREALAPRTGVVERKMFGGIAWMVTGNMAAGVIGEDLLVRAEAAEAEQLLAEEAHVKPFEMMQGRAAKGFVIVEAAAVQEDAALARWVDLGADYAASLPPK